MKGTFIQDYDLSSYVSVEYAAIGAVVVVLCLLSLLIVRVLKLYRLSESRLVGSTGHLVNDVLQKLEVFAVFQLDAFRDDCGKISFSGNENKTGQATYYLMGAVEYAIRKNHLSAQDRHILVVKLLQTNLGLCAKEVSKFYGRARALCSGSTDHNPIKTGAKAYKEWSNVGATSVPLTLSSVIL